MPIRLRSQRELQKMRDAGRIAAQILQRLREAVQPGISTADLDQLAERLTAEYGAISATKGYTGGQNNHPPFPGSVCTSVNEVIVHGIPDPRQILREGDLLKIDYTCIYQGWYGDNAITVPVGTISPEAAQLLRVTEECLYLGIAVARAGKRLGDIGHAVQSHAEAHGYGVVYELTGHGLGRKFHEEPGISHIGEPGTGTLLRPGMTFTIEPMINMGTPEINMLPDSWTIITADGKLSAQFEHTIAITTSEAEILTRP